MQRCRRPRRRRRPGGGGDTGGCRPSETGSTPAGAARPIIVRSVASWPSPTTSTGRWTRCPRQGGPPPTNFRTSRIIFVTIRKLIYHLSIFETTAVGVAVARLRVAPSRRTGVTESPADRVWVRETTTPRSFQTILEVGHPGPGLSLRIPASGNRATLPRAGIPLECVFDRRATPEPRHRGSNRVRLGREQPGPPAIVCICLQVSARILWAPDGSMRHGGRL